jgi:hypothetical protein
MQFQVATAEGVSSLKNSSCDGWVMVSISPEGVSQSCESSGDPSRNNMSILLAWRQELSSQRRRIYPTDSTNHENSAKHTSNGIDLESENESHVEVY